MDMNENKAYLLQPGTMLRETYRIDRTLGEGGFGITYCGMDVKLGLRVAIKEYYPYGYTLRETENECRVMPKPDEVSRRIFNIYRKYFLEEAEKLAQCSHIASVVNVREYFEENGTAYIIMEYLDGVTLKRCLEKNGKMDAVWLCREMLPLMRDLHRIHELGFVHRDISPDNIMILESGEFRLMDFGAARNFDVDEKRSMTVMLKHGFAPYEQYTRHGNQGPWTDIYALSATIYACITGVVPDTATDRRIRDKLVLPSELGAVISVQLQQVIMKGLSVMREDRWASALEMAKAVEAALNNKTILIERGTVIVEEDSGEPIWQKSEEEEKDGPEDAARRTGRTRGRKATVLEEEDTPRMVVEGPEKRKTGVYVILALLFIALAAAAAWMIRMESIPQEEYVKDVYAAEKIDESAGVTDTEPTATPSIEPTAAPSSEPTATPSPEPTAAPSSKPTATSSPEPTATPSPKPTAAPSPEPTAAPSSKPTATSSPEPTATPSPKPTAAPSPEPTATPSIEPTATPSIEPTAAPSPEPTAALSSEPTATPSPKPTATPSLKPTATPSVEEIAQQLLMQGQEYASMGDMQQAISCFEEAALLGNAEAMAYAGFFCLREGDSERGQKWIDQALALDNAMAMYVQGYAYASGIGMEEADVKQAVEWFEKAAQRGNRDAMLSLSYYYRLGGRRLLPDSEKADYWYQKAMETP